MPVYIVTATSKKNFAQGIQSSYPVATGSGTWTIKLGGLASGEEDVLRQQFPRCVFKKMAFTEISPDRNEIHTIVRFEADSIPPSPPIALIQDILNHLSGGCPNSVSTTTFRREDGMWYHSWTMSVC